MKTIALLVLTLGMFCQALQSDGATVVGAVGAAPAISSQPTDQTADYGTDVVFTIGATGDGLSYKWQKDGTRLEDYKNIAGASTPTLYLVGVSQKDMGKYRVIVTNFSGSITSAVVALRVNSSVVFNEDFESSNVSNNWKPLLEATNWIRLDASKNHTDKGTLSAGGVEQSARVYHKLNKKIRGRVRLTFWLYDDGASPTAYGELRGYQGLSGYAKYAHPFAMAQSLAIGYRSAVAGDTNSGVMAGETINPTKYQGGVLRGSKKESTIGWFNLDEPGAPSRSPGWHKFEIHRVPDQSAIDFYIDGVRGRRIRGAKPADIDTIVFGLGGAGETNQLAGAVSTAWFDDIQVDAYPEAIDYDNDPSGGVFSKIMQLRETGDGTPIANIAPITVSEQAGAARQSTKGTWAVDGQALYANDFRGAVDYAVAVPSDDMYRVEIEGRENGAKFPQADLPLTVRIDGESLGHYNLAYDGRTNGTVHCFTPFIKAGNHKLTVDWDNTRAGISLRLQAVRLQALPSSVTQNGVKTWVANRLAAQSGIESGPQSFVSPACIEGRGKYLSMMTILAGTPGAISPVGVHHALGDRWYADVPLSASNLTHVEVSYQNGGLVEERDIEWRVTNLLDPQNMTIRKGDSLLFTAVPPDGSTSAVSIVINGSTVTTDPAVPVPYAFNEAGLFSVTGTCGSFSATIWVRVVEVNLDPVVPVLKLRNHWDCPKLPAGVMLSYDHRLRMQRLYPTQDAAAKMTPPVAPHTNPFKIWNAATYEPRYILARIGGNQGSIVASTVVQGVQFAVPPESSLEMVGRNADGSQLIEGTYVLSPALPGLSIRFDLLTAGVTFADGTVSKTLTAADFNEFGIGRVRFVRAAGIEGSVCNEARVYHNGVLVVQK